jgi:hypothetical protein
VIVEDVKIMNLPQKKFFWQMTPDKIEQTTPSLVPLVEGEFEFSVVV